MGRQGRAQREEEAEGMAFFFDLDGWLKGVRSGEMMMGERNQGEEERKVGGEMMSHRMEPKLARHERLEPLAPINFASRST